MSLHEMESGLRRLWVSLECCSVGVWPPPDPRPCPPQEGSRLQAGGHSRQTCADGHLMERTVSTVKTSGERREWHARVRGGLPDPRHLLRLPRSSASLVQ